MIYELRCYVPVPGKEAALLARFEQTTLDLFARLGYEVVDFWHRTDGSGELWYVMRWDSEAAMRAAWEAFRANPEWIATKAATEAEGPLTKTLISIPLKRPPFFQPKAD